MMGKIGTGAMDMLESAGEIIANVSNWETQTEDWQKAATIWRDKYHELLEGQKECHEK